ncbi:uncharacterized protein LOC112568143 [Pomacea canaliculata]|uniref:uncharacterized protein LOC112568143 n=1 Tax=Pomacea canaliculata TaxID=400727 RepID=UPI000D728FDF|nr:uncharacterized protein LOC112568143 [Pomacea canaliculata]
MSCEIRNEECPVQIHCLFPTAADTDTRPFSLYFYSSQGSQELVLGCAYKENHTCFHQEGFEITHKGFNYATITVPDTFATSNGSFVCKKGYIDTLKNCSYHPSEICNTTSIWNTTGIGLGTTTKGINPTVLVGVILGLIVVMSIIIFCWVSKTYRCYGCSKKSPIYTVPPPVFPSEEYNKPCLEKENTGNHVNQTTTDPASSSLNGGIVETKKVFDWDNELTINEQKENVDQQHASTDTKISGASPGLQLSPSSSVSRTSCARSDTSVTNILHGVGKDIKK